MNRGTIGQILSTIGLILSFTPLAPIGWALMVIGAILQATAKPKSAEGDDERQSPTYGFSQFDNPTKGDSPIPVIYANDTASSNPGHMTSPVYLQAYATPVGQEDGDFAKAKSQKGQALSCLLAVAEGPIVGIEDIRVNDEPLFENVTAFDLGKGNASKKRFTIEGRRVDVKSVRVYLDGTLKGWIVADRTELVATGDGATTVWTMTLADQSAEVLESGELIFYRGQSAIASNRLDPDNVEHMKPIAWTDETRRTVYVNTQTPLASGERLWIGMTTRYCKDCTIKKAADGTGVHIDFTSAPGSGVKVTASWSRKLFPNVKVETRLGGSSQLPVIGFEDIRNSTGVTAALSRSPPVERTTAEPCDDVIVTIVSSSSGMTAYDSKDGGRSAVAAQVRIGYKPFGSTGPVNWLRDPAGKSTGKGEQEFKLSADSESMVTWAFSIRGLLRRYLDEHPDDTETQTRLANFTRQRYVISVERTNIVQSSSNSYIVDGVEWQSFTTVLEERLSHPGVALLAIHAIGSEKLNGVLPRITCRVVGKRDVEAYSAGAWTASETAQSNPVWAAIDVIANRRYGGGEQYTKAANIDTASAVTAAAWCDANVTVDSVTEKRSVIDYVMDTRKPLMEHVKDMLAPGQVVPVLRGNVWYFIVDRDVTLSSATTIYDDGTSSAILENSLSFEKPPVTAKITELQVSYLDRTEDWQRAEVWIAPTTPADDRRIERATAFGRTRASEVTRYASFLYAKATNRGVGGSFRMLPSGLPIQAGDVVRIISSRMGVDLYARVLRWTLESNEGLAIRVEFEQYVPAAYGGTGSGLTVLRSTQSKAKTGGTSAASASRDGTGESQSSGKVTAVAKRAA